VNRHWISYERQHEVLARSPDMLGRGENGPEIVAWMAKPAGRHAAVEKIDVAHESGVEGCRLIGRGLAAADQRAATRRAIFLEQFAQRLERWARAAIAQPRLYRILRLRSCRTSGAKRSGRVAAAKPAIRATAGRASSAGGSGICAVLPNGVISVDQPDAPGDQPVTVCSGAASDQRRIDGDVPVRCS
jgi:hypothetical protein